MFFAVDVKSNALERNCDLQNRKLRNCDLEAGSCEFQKNI